MRVDLSNTPLVILDLQKAIDHPDWGIRNNPEAEANIAALLQVWRANTWPVIHVKHNSSGPRSHYRTGQDGNNFKTVVVPISGEAIAAKTVHSAFVESDLRNALEALGTKTFILAGVKTNNSIETTVRHGSNLGYDIHLLADGCFTHDQIDWTGKRWAADDIHAIALSNLDGEYCRVTTSKHVLRGLSVVPRAE